MKKGDKVIFKDNHINMGMHELGCRYSVIYEIKEIDDAGVNRAVLIALDETTSKWFDVGLLKLVAKKKNNVDHPSHYNAGKFEVIDVIEDWALGFHLGNSLKYIARAEHKANKLEDLKKARWYLNREIQNLEKKNG